MRKNRVGQRSWLRVHILRPTQSAPPCVVVDKHHRCRANGQCHAEQQQQEHRHNADDIHSVLNLRVSFADSNRILPDCGKSHWESPTLSKSEIRNPKSERNPKPDKTAFVRISAFGFLSGFGFRISDFAGR